MAADFDLPEHDLATALAALESEGAVFRGRFHPGAPSEEWCERRLLARIHRGTINRLRKGVRAVTAADYLHFLTHWQGLREQRSGVEGLAGALEQLEGFQAPAAAWEEDILPLRIQHYLPTDLDQLCLAGRIAWTRLAVSEATVTARNTPITLVERERLDPWRNLFPTETDDEASLSRKAAKLLARLRELGPSFFRRLCKEQTPTLVKGALGELVARGLVTSDSYAGLRALLAKPDRRLRRKGRSLPMTGLDLAGRWSLVEDAEPVPDADCVELLAHSLLRRWGVVFRKVLEREGLHRRWRDLVRVYRRMEARGELRGGRFVEGFGGEQYALPEALTLLRRLKRESKDGGESFHRISAADPLNLTGLITPTERIPAQLGNRVLLRNGLPVAALTGREVRFLGTHSMDDKARFRYEVLGIDPTGASRGAGRRTWH